MTTASDLEIALDPIPSAVTGPNPTTRRRARGLVLGVDALAVAAGLLAARALFIGNFTGVRQPGHHVGAWVVAYVPFYLIALGAYGMYRRDRRRLFTTTFPDLLHLGHALVAAGVATYFASAWLGSHGVAPALTPAGTLVLSLPALLSIPAGRVAAGIIVRRRGIVRSRVIIVGSGNVADSLAFRLGSIDDLDLLGWVDDPSPYADGYVSSVPRLGELADLARLCAVLDADRVIVAFSPASTTALTDTLRDLPPGVKISVVPRLFDLLTWRSHVDELKGLPVMDVAPPELARVHRAVKRTVDVAVAAFALLVLSPVLAVIAILIKATSPGPVFFRQERSGRRGLPFRIFKFRTMYDGADRCQIDLRDANEVDGPLFKMKTDPRVTKVGAILRSTSLDEVPQLLNVLRGEMSLVGPRPFVLDEASRIEGWASRRFDVRPGMTGLWQVSGRNDLPYEELRRLDYAYVASWSLWWDLKIAWQTPGSVLRRRGAY